MRDLAHRFRLWEAMGYEEAAGVPESQLRRAGALGDVDALWELVELLEGADRHEEAKQVWYDAASTGDTRAMRELASRLTTEGEAAKAERWIRMAERRDDAHARRWLTVCHEGKATDSDAPVGRQIYAGDVWGMAERLASKERRDEADRWLRLAIENGELAMVGQLVDKMEEAGRGDVVEGWLRDAQGNGNRAVTMVLSNLLRDSDRQGEAEELLREAIGRGEPVAEWHLARLLETSGRYEEAERHWLRLLDAMKERGLRSS